MKGIVIAGTHSGCGKTTAALGVMAALREKGLSVQPFKAGPDFIDAGLHRLAAGRVSRNLDLWMCGEEYARDTFARHAAAADIAVVEGVMGMYDGEQSTARLAAELGTPVVLVVDAYGMAESAGAIVKGFVDCGLRIADCGLKFTGVIFNRVASESHYKRLKGSVRDVPVLGYLPREATFEIPHRHLGLATVEEEPISQARLETLADSVLEHVDIDAILRAAHLNTSTKVGIAAQSAIRNPQSAIKIAVASDKAFSFYYEDNLDLLREAGVEIIRFSPLADAAIPDADIVYFGGGYPELHARALSANRSMISSVKKWVDAGRPLYAECGGLMYLSQGVRGFDGEFFPLAGVFPFATRMLSKPKLGYREITLSEDCILGNKGEKLRGHEFHYSEIDEVRSAECEVRSEENKMVYVVQDALGGGRGKEGYRFKNALASYIHLHFGSNSSVASRFADFVKGANIG